MYWLWIGLNLVKRIYRRRAFEACLNDPFFGVWCDDACRHRFRLPECWVEFPLARRGFTDDLDSSTTWYNETLE